MDDKMQITQPARAQFRPFRAETTDEIRPKPKLVAVLYVETETRTEIRSTSNNLGEFSTISF